MKVVVVREVRIGSDSYHYFPAGFGMPSSKKAYKVEPSWTSGAGEGR